MKKLICLLLTGLLALPVAAQTNQELALEKKSQAVELMDSEQIDESILLLNEAKAMDPENFAYDYEIGYAYFLKNDYKSSLKVFKQVVKYKNADDQCYQMLGNLYDFNGLPDKALKAYDRGLKVFPNSGRLYLEKGNVYWGQGKYIDALPFYERGIYLDPQFPSNYYRAALIYCNSSEEVWGMIYGEIFMNLERNSQRTSEISKLLYDTYKSQIQFTSDTSISVSFSQMNNITINANDLKRNPELLIASLKIPYGIGVYEPTLIMSLPGQKEINMNSLDTIRTNFIKHYFENDKNTTYPNVLFDYNKQMMDMGLLEAYNYWILRKGDEETFGKWYDAHKTEWKNFMDWFTENPLFINEDSRFYSGQY
jgi:hypothetical protein